MYNLKNDIGETENLSEKHPDLVRELHSKLVAWRSEVGAPVPLIPNPDYDPGYDKEQRAIRRGLFC
jgi:hypothetical protein